MALFPKLDGPMKLLASSEDSIRAWPGGFGYAKLGANYGPSLMAQKEAQSERISRFEKAKKYAGSKVSANQSARNTHGRHGQ